MTGRDELTILAEVGIGLAGFSSVVFAIRGRDDAHSWASYRALGLLATSFHVLFLSLVPFLIHAFGPNGPELWRLSGAVGLLITLPTPVAMLRA